MRSGTEFGQFNPGFFLLKKTQPAFNSGDGIIIHVYVQT